MRTSWTTSTAWGARSGGCGRSSCTGPGRELRRLTPRNNDDLLFDGVPWLDRAQEEHDQFAETLRAHDVEVLYLHELLDRGARRRRGARPAARQRAAARPDRPVARPGAARAPRPAAVRGPRAGADGGHGARGAAGAPRRARRAHGRAAVVRHPPAAEPAVHARLRASGSTTASRSRSSRCRRGGARARSPARSTRHHPRFAGTELLYGGSPEDQAWLEGGDVLVLAPGVLAIGVGQRTSPAGVEAFAQRLFVAGAARRGAGRADLAGPRDDAPRHRLHDGRPRRGGHVPAAGRHARGLRRRAAAASATASRSWPPRRARWASASCA